MLAGRQKRLIADFAELFRKEFNVGLPVKGYKLEEAVEELGGCIVETCELSFASMSDIEKKEDGSFAIRIMPRCKMGDRYSFELARAIGKLFFTYGYLVDEERWNELPCGVQDRYGGYDG